MSDSSKSSLSYRDAGVDIEAGERLVEAISPLAKATRRAGVMGGLGGFGALFDLKAEGWRDPVLVSGTDGVGTKLMLAFETGIHKTVGIDLVAMCANDVLAQGAEPLFFLDYFATGALDVDAGQSRVGRRAAASIIRESGAGGESLSGLARAFFSAGARTVLATHWPVADAETTLPMKRFYGQLKSHLVCLTCDNVSNTFDPFSILSIPVPVVKIVKLKITYYPNLINPTLGVVNLEININDNY